MSQARPIPYRVDRIYNARHSGENLGHIGILERGMLASQFFEKLRDSLLGYHLGSHRIIQYAQIRMEGCMNPIDGA